MAIIEAIKSVYLEVDASSVDWTSIPTTYEHLMIRGTATEEWSNADRSEFGLRFNGDTGDNYGGAHSVNALETSATHTNGAGAGTSLAQIAIHYTIPGGKFGPFDVGCTEVLIPDYLNTNKNKSVWFAGGFAGDGASQPRAANSFGHSVWDSTAAINQITIVDTPWSSLNFARGAQWTLYGIKSS